MDKIHSFSNKQNVTHFPIADPPTRLSSSFGLASRLAQARLGGSTPRLRLLSIQTYTISQVVNPHEAISDLI